MSESTSEPASRPVVRRSPTTWRAVGHIAWWIFVVAQLMASGPGFGGLPGRYAPYLPNSGWTAYTPLTDAGTGWATSGPFTAGFTDANVLATTAAVALLVTIVAAFGEAVTYRSWATGGLTVAAPVIGGALVFVAIAAQRGDIWGGVYLRPMLAALIVLLGVAIREVWSRGFAPAAVASRRR